MASLFLSLYLEVEVEGVSGGEGRRGVWLKGHVCLFFRYPDFYFELSQILESFDFGVF